MPKALQNQVVLTDQPKSYEELFERLVAFWSNEAVLRTAAGAITDNRPDDPMDANSVWQEGKTGGKGND